MNSIPSCSGWGWSAYVGTPPDVAMADMSDGGRVYHTCGVAASDGHMECWGADSCNRVSDAPTTGAYSFTSVGAVSSCAIVHTTATASCWGCACSSNDEGQCDVRCPVFLTLTNNHSFMRRGIIAANRTLKPQWLRIVLRRQCECITVFGSLTR